MQAAGAEGGAEGITGGGVQDLVERLRDVGDVQRINEECGVAGNIGKCARDARDDGCTACHSLEAG